MYRIFVYLFYRIAEESQNCYFPLIKSFDIDLFPVCNYRDGPVLIGSKNLGTDLLVPFHDLCLREMAYISFPDAQDGIGRFDPVQKWGAA